MDKVPGTGILTSKIDPLGKEAEYHNDDLTEKVFSCTSSKSSGNSTVKVTSTISTLWDGWPKEWECNLALTSVKSKDRDQIIMALVSDINSLKK